MLRLAGVAAKRLYPDLFFVDAITPRLQVFRQVVVGLVQRVFRVAGQGEVQLAKGNGFGEVEQVLRNALGINRAREVADALRGRGRVPHTLPPGALRLAVEL